MILNALAERLKRRAKSDFKGRHFEALLYGNHDLCTSMGRQRAGLDTGSASGSLAGGELPVPFGGP
jgi:hypothetical protein